MKQNIWQLGPVCWYPLMMHGKPPNRAKFKREGQGMFLRVTVIADIGDGYGTEEADALATRMIESALAEVPGLDSVASAAFYTPEEWDKDNAEAD